jgi:hypothetical protein
MPTMWNGATRTFPYESMHSGTLGLSAHMHVVPYLILGPLGSAEGATAKFIVAVDVNKRKP